MTWMIGFYSEKVKDESLGLPAGIVVNLVHILALARKRMKEVQDNG